LGRARAAAIHPFFAGLHRALTSSQLPAFAPRNGVLMLGAGLQARCSAFVHDRAFPTPVIGVVMSCYYIGYLLGTIAPRA